MAGLTNEGILLLYHQYIRDPLKVIQEFRVDCAVFIYGSLPGHP